MCSNFTEIASFTATANGGDVVRRMVHNSTDNNVYIVYNSGVIAAYVATSFPASFTADSDAPKFAPHTREIVGQGQGQTTFAVAVVTNSAG